jgi:hypothetical protein
MNLTDAQILGERRWGHYGLGRAWHMTPSGKPEWFKLEWPDGVERGRGDSFDEAFADADRREQRVIAALRSDEGK